MNKWFRKLIALALSARKLLLAQIRCPPVIWIREATQHAGCLTHFHNYGYMVTALFPPNLQPQNMSQPSAPSSKQCPSSCKESAYNMEFFFFFLWDEILSSWKWVIARTFLYSSHLKIHSFGALGGGGRVYNYGENSNCLPISLMIFATLSQLLLPVIPHLVSSASPASYQIKVHSSFSTTLLLWKNSIPSRTFFFFFLGFYHSWIKNGEKDRITK